MSKNSLFTTYAKELAYLTAVTHNAIAQNEAVIAAPECRVTAQGESAKVTVKFTLLSCPSKDLQTQMKNDDATRKKLLETLKAYSLDDRELGTNLAKECTYKNGHAIYTIVLNDITKLTPLADTVIERPSQKISEIVGERKHKTPPQSALALINNAKEFHRNGPAVSPLNVPVKASIERHKLNHATAKPQDYTRSDGDFLRRYAMLNSGIQSWQEKLTTESSTELKTSSLVK